ncbi:MAG: hypothetical protein KF821_09685 [Anaerolineales bacterium]|jgi:hypothetical protein|nr:hypothetical protein [Anaerolineales bacterium]MBX3006080.1 hypothetical protein [Anaerolineales bacterium]MCW5887246.1 hypothetical protein [Anaerolineales bacterium]
MAYSFTNSKGTTYYLHARSKPNKSGGTTTLYFFSKEVKDGAVESLPAGYQVAEMKTGLPVLKKDQPAA